MVIMSNGEEQRVDLYYHDESVNARMNSVEKDIYFKKCNEPEQNV